MSEMMYTFASWDSRCRTVLFTVRAWARHYGVTTAASPSTKITNFSLLLLVIAFLQMKHVLPTIHELEELADDRDLVVYHGNPHLFLRHVTPEKIEQWKKLGKYNVDTPSQLLTDFFYHYKQFAFESRAITISDVMILGNPTRDALYIVNPLEQTLNVARNVRSRELEHFKQQCANAWSVLSHRQFNQPLDEWVSLFDRDNPFRRSKPNLIAEIFK